MELTEVGIITVVSLLMTFTAAIVGGMGAPVVLVAILLSVAVSVCFFGNGFVLARMLYRSA